MCVRPIWLREQKVHAPCGFCVECRSRYARMWAIRCVHEASLHEENCFGTLTYDDEHMPEHGSLRKRDFQLFMKRLRKSLGDKKVRFYHAGEYGDLNFRPHYHFLLFGHSFGNRTILKESCEFVLYRSGELESLWQSGLSSVGDVSFRSANYVARYVMKKVDQVGRKKKYSCDPLTGELHEIEPEYSTMSRRPGIGRGWYEKYGEEVVRLESVRMDGAELQPPRYYDALLRERDEAAFEVMKLRRERKAKEHWSGKAEPYSEDRRDRMAREVIARKRLEDATRRVVNA